MNILTATILFTVLSLPQTAVLLKKLPQSNATMVFGFKIAIFYIALTMLSRSGYRVFLNGAADDRTDPMMMGAKNIYKQIKNFKSDVPACPAKIIDYSRLPDLVPATDDNVRKFP